jgi:glycosyltransferase involved in cell wall biosynthesis
MQYVEYVLKKSVYKNKNKITHDIIQLIYNIEKEACCKSKYILTCSDEDKDTLTKLYNVSPDKFIVAPNGVDCNEIAFVSREERRALKGKLGLENELLAIFIGSWHPPNIEACKYIIDTAENVPQVKFLIVGSVCGAIKDKKIPSNVGLMGVVSDEAKNLILSVADIALNPITSGSGTNLKMFDYMAAGLPVITTEFGARGIDRDGLKSLIICDIDKMSDALHKIISSDMDIYYKETKNARYMVENKYDWRIIAEKILKEIKISQEE